MAVPPPEVTLRFNSNSDYLCNKKLCAVQDQKGKESADYKWIGLLAVAAKQASLNASM